MSNRLTLSDIVARNVKAAREHRGYTSWTALAKDADVAVNSIKHIENPSSRLPTARGSTSPRLDILDKLAKQLGYPTWQLLTEEFDPKQPLAETPISRAERDLYDRIEESYKQLADQR